MKVLTKAEFGRLWQRRALGNRLRVWTLREWPPLDYGGTVTIRYLEGGTPFCAYEVPLPDVLSVVEGWQKQGASPEKVMINESAPDRFLTIQGEIQYLSSGLHLFYGRERVKMREALKKGVSSRGLQALMLLKGAFSPSSYSDLEALFDLYPDSVVEFSAYEMFLGDCPGRNVLIWEVRDY